MIQKKDLEQKLIEKALKDESFRKQLLVNTKDTIEIELGMKIPGFLKIKIVEEDPQTVYLVLPPVPSRTTVIELSDIELEAVAGGVVPPPPTDDESTC